MHKDERIKRVTRVYISIQLLQKLSTKSALQNKEQSADHQSRKNKLHSSYIKRMVTE